MAFDATLINYIAKICLNSSPIYLDSSQRELRRESAKQLVAQIMTEVIARIDEKRNCDHCKQPFSREVRYGPILKDESWLQLAAEYETLCGSCVFERAATCGVPITFADLQPCAFNLKSGAQSWFETFGGENVSECEEWAEACQVNDECGPIRLAHEPSVDLFEPKGGTCK